VCSAVREGERLRAVIVENKSGRIACAARAYVDCTGDADLAALAGCEMISEPGQQTQPVNCELRNLDFARLRAALLSQGVVLD
jgi:hypothetical protein